MQTRHVHRDIPALEQILGVEFTAKDLLLQAVTHRSYLNEHPEARAVGHNERLEFLGDAVLELIVTEHLYRTFPDRPEGDLTNYRAILVNAEQAAATAETFDLWAFMRLSRGERASTTMKTRKFILADAFEALLGALLLDQGMGECRLFLDRVLLTGMKRLLDTAHFDPKSVLQDRTQTMHRITPTYVVVSEQGPDHAKRFRLECRLGDRTIGSGEGESKKEAKVAAARDALQRMSEEESRVTSSAATDVGTRASRKGK